MTHAFALARAANARRTALLCGRRGEEGERTHWIETARDWLAEAKRIREAGNGTS